MKLLLVCGPWGSGTSAVAGVLARLGAVGFGPYFDINDPDWSNSYELVPFREALLPFMSEDALELGAGAEQDLQSSIYRFRVSIENQEFGPYDAVAGRPIFLKYPLSALAIPHICKVFDTKLIYVLRPFADIERTRIRRRWKVQLGSRGAEIIYSHMFQTLVDYAYPTMLLRYSELVKVPARVARELVQFAELSASPAEIQHAANFIKPPRALSATTIR